MRQAALLLLAGLGLAACQTAPVADAGFLGGYDGLVTREDTIRASIRQRRDDAAVTAIDVPMPTAADVGDKISKVLGCMSRSVQRLKLDVADFENVAIVQKSDVGMAARPFALPVRPAFGGNVHVQCGIGPEFPCAAYEVRMDMRFGNGREAQPFLCGGRTIAVDVALGIDDDGLAGFLATDEIGVLREMRVEDLA